MAQEQPQHNQQLPEHQETRQEIKQEMFQEIKQEIQENLSNQIDPNPINKQQLPSHPFAMTYPSKYQRESDKFDSVAREIERYKERYRMMEEERYMLHQNISYLKILPRSYGYNLPPLENDLDIFPVSSNQSYVNDRYPSYYDHHYRTNCLFFVFCCFRKLYC